MTIKQTRAINFMQRGCLSVENANGSLLEASLKMTFGDGDGDAPNMEIQSNTANTLKIRWNSLAMELHIPASCHCSRFGNEMAWSQSCRAFHQPTSSTVAPVLSFVVMLAGSVGVTSRHVVSPPTEVKPSPPPLLPNWFPCTGRVTRVAVNPRLCVSPQPRTKRCRPVAPRSGSSGG